MSYNYICNDCEEPFDEPDTETWSDPGDYPSGAGCSPLPSYDYDVCPHCGSSDFKTFDEDNEKDNLIERIYDRYLPMLDYDTILELSKPIEKAYNEAIKKQKENKK